MAEVLTTDSTIICGHRGQAQIPSTLKHKLTVGTKSVLLKDDLNGATINGCTIQDDPNTGASHCKSIVSVTGGWTTKLTVGNQPVLLKTLTGTTDGGTPPPSTLKASSAQSTLTVG